MVMGFGLVGGFVLDVVQSCIEKCIQLWPFIVDTNVEFWIKQQVFLVLTMAMHLLDESLDDTVLLVVW